MYTREMEEEKRDEMEEVSTCTHKRCFVYTGVQLYRLSTNKTDGVAVAAIA